jgi:hypothetical protein
VSLLVFPQTPLAVTIELFYSGAWNDITQYVYHRDAAPIVITRGRPNENSRCDPGEMSLTFNNRDGRFSPRNPNSPLFGLIGRNTPVRTKITYNAVTYTRFTGEIYSWPSRWDVSGRDIWIPVKAAGILRRLGQGTKPQRSPLYRTMLGGLGSDIPAVAYWPLEDGAAGSRFASPVTGVDNMTIITPVTLESDASITGSFPLPAFGAGSGGRGVIPTYADTGFWVAQNVCLTSDLGAGFTAMTLDVSGGTAATVSVGYNTTQLSLVARDSAGATIGGGVQVDTFDISPSGEPLSIVVAFKDNASGSNDFLYARAMTGSGTVVASIDFNVGAGVYGRAFAVYPNGKLQTATATIGHCGFYTDPTFVLGVDDVANALAIDGLVGETATARFARVCTQSAIPYSVVGTTAARMGAESQATMLEVLREAEDVDQGFLFETRDSLGLKLRTNSSRYNQVPIALHYNTGNISPPFDPEPDDFTVANDREVKRTGGSSDRRELTTGALSTQDPPNGVGRYDDTITVVAFEDDQLDHIASWRLHVGTWDAERYPRVTVDLSVAANSTIIASIAAADSGDMITIDGLPAWLPPETAELLIEGYEETIGFFDWDFVFNCSPAGPYNVVGVWDMTAVLHTAMNTSVTSADIATTAGPLLATTGLGSAGYGITIGGETLQVTAVAASTVTFGTTGTAAHANNASVTPGIPASVATGDLLLCLAAIRSSGTGVPSTPAGYTRLAVFNATDNVQLFAKIATSGAEAAPTVSFTGGAAGDDTSAQMIRLSGKWHSTSNVLLASAACLNTTAQDITYPGLSLPAADNCIILYLGWKQDDWTSVATISGATEIGEPSTVTGNDQGMVWDYKIQTTAAAIAPGTFVVTGGATAISRGAVLALRADYQTATVTRSTNGVSASHSALDVVSVTKPMRWAL